MERHARFNRGKGSYQHKTADKNKERRHWNNKENKKVSVGNGSSLLLDRKAKVHVQPGKTSAVDDDAHTCPRKAMVDLIGTGYQRVIPHKDMLSDGCCNDQDAANMSLHLSACTRLHEHEDLRKMGMIDAVPAGFPQRPPAPWDHGRLWQQQHQQVMVHGRALLELLSLSANFVIKGTIALFDGKGAQIIYENYDRGQGDAHLPTCSNNPEAGFTDLILTGPHTAISADGESFAIKLDPSGPNDDEREDAREIWECGICEGDGIVESVISTDKGKIRVTYAVLNNAVEATVQVNLVGLFAADTQEVYGRITAHIENFVEEDSILLLSRPAQDPLQLIPSDDDAFIVPLSRSIIVVPVDSCIDVLVDIYATSIHQDTPSVRFQDKLRFPFSEHTLPIQTAMGDLTVSVNITH